ncbi:hypothetical protein GCM10009678_80750 [Actinomadura kijaniata]|uniref:Secreted protein n=1 Tax=Actinomadura namibiensis TaxID=182080 RepID=A0A7W3LVQ5_ACTNM|nr:MULTISPECIES: hypothetical protein [Actinomadura]MBA8955208.1 hypothetical protein [Actinomadura namibiensis]
MPFSKRTALKAGVVGLAAGACLGVTTGGALAAAPADTADKAARTCHVRPDGKLFCENKRDANLFEHPNSTSRVVDTLKTSPSVFACYRRGEWHHGGNDVWYYTNGDVTKRWGYIPAVHLYTTTDPPAGMRAC